MTVLENKMFLLGKIEWTSDEDRFEAIGYLAKPGVIDAIEATVPADKLKKFRDESSLRMLVMFDSLQDTFFKPEEMKEATFKVEGDANEQ